MRKQPEQRPNNDRVRVEVVHVGARLRDVQLEFSAADSATTLKAIADGRLPPDTFIPGESREARMRRLNGDAVYIDYQRTESEAKDRILIKLAERARAARQPVAFRIGERQYRVGDTLIKITNTQDEALFALIQMGGVASFDELKRKTEIKRADKLLKRAIESNPILATVLKLPGKKGNGHYCTTIKLAPS